MGWCAAVLPLASQVLAFPSWRTAGSGLQLAPWKIPSRARTDQPRQARRQGRPRAAREPLSNQGGNCQEKGPATSESENLGSSVSPGTSNPLIHMQPSHFPSSLKEPCLNLGHLTLSFSSGFCKAAPPMCVLSQPFIASPILLSAVS